MSQRSIAIRNGLAVAIDVIPRLEPAAFQAALAEAIKEHARIAALFGVAEDRLTPGAADSELRLVAVLAREEGGELRICSTTVKDRFESLTPRWPECHRFEREIYEQWGIEPVGHPWLKPVRFQKPFRMPSGSPIEPSTIGVKDFFRVGGGETHEVAVGPVHAGIIEPGHFRFQCHGEHVYHLETALGYQHRGIERALVGGPSLRTLHLIETAAGDTTIGHATAYAVVTEALTGAAAPPRALALRAVALELERLANHTGDLGALSGDVAYLPTASYCGRIRGDFLNLTASISGNRFGRGLIVPGGTAFDVDEALAKDLLERLTTIVPDLQSAVGLLWATPSVMARFEGVGTLARDLCQEVGMVGVVARAAGLARDVRSGFPLAGDPSVAIPISLGEKGDVASRARVRWLECERSIEFVKEQLARLPAGSHRVPVAALPPRRLAVALVEAWRGEICHVALTDDQGRFLGYKIVDPSFHNWTGLALVMRDQQISDFPLCNKSFNLSYCGADL